jgi:heme A synthase
MTRATHETLQGRLGEAFRFNPLGMILMPVASVGLGIEVLNWARKKPLPVRLKVSARGAWILVGVIIGFGILRNIPLWPLTLLAPP